MMEIKHGIEVNKQAMEPLCMRPVLNCEYVFDCVCVFINVVD